MIPYFVYLYLFNNKNFYYYSIDQRESGLHAIQTIIADLDRYDLSTRCDTVQFRFVRVEACGNGSHMSAMRTCQMLWTIFIRVFYSKIYIKSYHLKIWQTWISDDLQNVFIGQNSHSVIQHIHITCIFIKSQYLNKSCTRRVKTVVQVWNITWMFHIHENLCSLSRLCSFPNRPPQSCLCRLFIKNETDQVDLKTKNNSFLHLTATHRHHSRPNNHKQGLHLSLYSPSLWGPQAAPASPPWSTCLSTENIKTLKIGEQLTQFEPRSAYIIVGGLRCGQYTHCRWWRVLAWSSWQGSGGACWAAIRLLIIGQIVEFLLHLHNRLVVERLPELLLAFFFNSLPQRCRAELKQRLHATIEFARWIQPVARHLYYGQFFFLCISRLVIKYKTYLL